MLYIDEFQVYANPGFEDMLTQGRSYRVASHLATQTRALIGRGGQEGRDFLEVVSTNARNLVIYPGGSADDAAYYEKLFGEEEEVKLQKGVSRQKLSILSLFAPFKPEQESVRESTEMTAKYSATDLMYQPFGRIFYRFIKNNSVQEPGISQIEYIPIELNNLLDQMVEEYNAQQEITQIDPPMKDEKQLKESSTPTEEVEEAEIEAIDPLEMVKQQKSQKVSSDEDYIFIDEKEDKTKRANTHSDVVDLEDGDVFEF